MVPSAHTAENHDFISSDHGRRSSTSKSLFRSARSQAVCWAQAPCLHALTALLSLVNQLSPLDDSCGSLCFRYCHVLLSIVFKFACFLDSSFSSTMDKYRTIRGGRPHAGLLNGYNQPIMVRRTMLSAPCVCLGFEWMMSGWWWLLSFQTRWCHLAFLVLHVPM